MSAWKAILAALVIFAAGVVTGQMTMNLQRKAGLIAPVPQNQPGRPGPSWTPDRVEKMHRELMTRMESSLELTPEQHAKISSLVDESRSKLTKLSHEAITQTRTEMEQLRGKIRKELKPEQEAKFERVFRPRPPGWTQQRQWRENGRSNALAGKNGFGPRGGRHFEGKDEPGGPPPDHAPENELPPQPDQEPRSGTPQR